MNTQIILNSFPVMFPVECEKEIRELMIETPIPPTLYEVLSLISHRNQDEQNIIEDNQEYVFFNS